MRGRQRGIQGDKERETWQGLEGNTEVVVGRQQGVEKEGMSSKQ